MRTIAVICFYTGHGTLELLYMRLWVCTWMYRCMYHNYKTQCWQLYLLHGKKFCSVSPLHAWKGDVMIAIGKVACLYPDSIPIIIPSTVSISACNCRTCMYVLISQFSKDCLNILWWKSYYMPSCLLTAVQCANLLSFLVIIHNLVSPHLKEKKECETCLIFHYYHLLNYTCTHTSVLYHMCTCTQLILRHNWW